jgi:pimeloyl-ACP methyl ester carboxylesterase
MATVVSSSVTIDYEAFGAGRPAFLLIHGWSCDRSSMQPLALLLAEHGRVVNVDLREHGHSGPSAGYGKDDVVADLAAVLAEERLGEVVVVGHSLGAKYALALSQTSPCPASAVVLLDTSIIETNERRTRRLAELDEEDGEGRRARLEGMFLPSDAVSTREDLIASMLAVPRDVGRRALLAGDAIDTAGALRDCPVPVLYVGCARPRESKAVMNALRPRLAYTEIAGVGHFLQVFAPQATCDAILRFVACAVG